MKVSDMGAVVGVIFLILCMFGAVQYNFLAYYQKMGIPFGNSDVDEYMKDINKPTLNLGDHVLIVALSKAFSRIMDPGLFLTYYIPLLLCIVLPMCVFLMVFVISGDGTVALYSTLTTVFGTMTILAFGISAMWAQMESTILIMLFIIFYEIYQKDKDIFSVLTLCFLTILSFLAHYKSVVLIFLYIAIRNMLSRTGKLMVLSSLLCLVFVLLFHGSVFDPYPYEVDAYFVFTHFMFTPVWLLSLYFIYYYFYSSSEKLKGIMILSLAVLIASSFVVQWRPLLTVLPMFSMFATMELFRRMDKTTPTKAIIIGVGMMLLMMLFFAFILQNYLFMMYQEMVPGVYNSTRTSVSLQKFADMYFGGNTHLADEYIKGAK